MKRAMITGICTIVAAIITAIATIVAANYHKEALELQEKVNTLQIQINELQADKKNVSQEQSESQQLIKSLKERNKELQNENDVLSQKIDKQSLPDSTDVNIDKENLKDDNAKYDLLTILPPYQTSHYGEWKNMSMGGNKYAKGFSLGAESGFTNWGEEGYALFNLSKKYRLLSFEVGNLDERGTRRNEVLYIYLDNELVWSLDLDPEALPALYEIDISNVTQMKFVSSEGAGDYGVTNLYIE